ncbi:putative RNA-dependent RNA polymerase 3 [Apostasia shenzhenica]|uniref:RNA-dependent RNA polymerase n=1 Tax=Apostasia shenzhenica TaxID=1088818 RepID=A0A2I0B6H5_9ASPA|nr:putative RNA-dependent RNA polymerase 3 [Apostasia shenzhenica]
MAVDPSLPPPVEDLLARICGEQSLPPPDCRARRALAAVGEEVAVRILRELANQRVRNLSAYINFKCKNSAVILARNAEAIPTQESACYSGPRTPRSASDRDDAASELTSPACGMPLHVPVASAVMSALGMLEFRQAFLILSYCGLKKLDDTVSLELINRIKGLSMVLFESEVWKNIGRHCIQESERRKPFDTHLAYFLLQVFKDGGKEEKKKNPMTSPVKCHFVRTESCWAMDEMKPYILFNKAINEARCMFMHIHTVSTIAKYIARFSLILSKTIKLDADLASVNINVTEDIPCKDEEGRIIYDEDGESMVHTDGTGFISEDLALKYPKNISKGRCLDLKDMELPARTICIRPSMIKVKTDPDALAIHTCNSLEIVGTSNKPKKTCLSRSLVALLHYGGVPKECFLELLRSAIEDFQSARYNKRSALKVSLRYGEMDDYLVSRMILCGIPLDEPFLLSRLLVLMKEERKGLIDGKLPVDDCYYLMGTADPTGTLNPDEVCIMLDNGQVSGDVLVYKHPGLHFGDIHRLTAKYVKGMEDIIGNSKYGIFFPVKGRRSLTDEIANSDLDGDMYWICRNAELLAYFTPANPWVRPTPVQRISQPKPSDFSSCDLERELFQQFLINRFSPSRAISMASSCWMAFMDRLLTLGDDCLGEKQNLREKLVRLVNIYYDALDAPKSGLKVEVPRELMAEQYPHFMGRTNSYVSKSILGMIFDEVNSVQMEGVPLNEVWQIPCFSEEVPQYCLKMWEKRYDDYRCEMMTALSGPQESRDKLAEEVIHKYKKLLYEADELEESTRRREDIFNEAIAIYQIAYKMAKATKRSSYCSFAWRVAGHALCLIHTIKQEEDATFLCLRSVLREIFG